MDKLRDMILSNPRAGIVKANPKIHENEMPIRTFISSINSTTERLAEIAECELEQWVTSLPTYIQDSTQFLRTLEELNAIPKNNILFIMDIKGVYPPPPHVRRVQGLRACEEALNKQKLSEHTNRRYHGNDNDGIRQFFIFIE